MPLPSVPYLMRLDAGERRALLATRATVLYRQAAHAFVSRRSLAFMTDDELRQRDRARRSVRDRLRRLYRRADEVAVDIGQAVA